MGSKPKPQQYQPSEVEKTQARIAKADQEFFEQTYDPLLVKMRDDSLKQDTRGTLRGRAQADTMQTLTGDGANLNLARDVNTSANIASGAVGNILQSNVLAKDVKNKMQTNVLGTARGQAADAGSGLAAASKLARSEDLNRATARISRASNIMGNIGRVGSAGIRRYARKGSELFASPNTDPGGFSFQSNPYGSNERTA
tara:strand:- start:2194 stop:2790 length:597 start_codon:yes stop_codon:yes gene_type:complete